MNIKDGKLNLVTITVEQAREIDVISDDEELATDIVLALNEAQERVFTGEAKRSFLVIEITE